MTYLTYAYSLSTWTSRQKRADPATYNSNLTNRESEGPLSGYRRRKLFLVHNRDVMITIISASKAKLVTLEPQYLQTVPKYFILYPLPYLVALPTLPCRCICRQRAFSVGTSLTQLHRFRRRE